MRNINLISPRELADHSGWPERRIRNLLREGQLRHVRVGVSYLVPKTAIDEFIERNMVEPTSCSRLKPRDA